MVLLLQEWPEGLDDAQCTVEERVTLRQMSGQRLQIQARHLVELVALNWEPKETAITKRGLQEGHLQQMLGFEWASKI